MEFRRIELSDRGWVERLRDTAVNPMTVLSFQAIYTWKEAFGLEIWGDEDFFVIRSKADGGYYYPCGNQRKCRDFVTEQFHKEKQIKYLYVPKSEIPWLNDLGLSVMLNRDTSEYIYESHALALEGERISKNFRRKYRTFCKKNTFTISDASVQEKDKLNGFFEDWEDLRLPRQLHDDRGAARIALDNLDSLSMSGILLQTEGKEWAFLLGYESTPEIYDMAVVKYSRMISEDVVAVCICEMAKMLCGKYRYINLEDDMGIPGLRTMKTLYKPVFLLDSYTAFV